MVAAFNGNLLSFITFPKLLPVIDTPQVPHNFLFNYLYHIKHL
jgi:hypothetical protein